jgi:hypothetical protein
MRPFGTISSLAFHEKSEMVGSLSQLNLESFKFSKIGIIPGPYWLCK